MSRCRDRPTRISCARRTRTRKSTASILRKRRPRPASSPSIPAPTCPTASAGLPCGWLITDVNGQPMKEPKHPLLAQGKVRHVGDQVAVVIAETLNQAKDAAELIEVDYEVLPAIVNVADARKAPGAAVHDIAPDNTCYVWALGDKAAVDKAFAQAAHVTKLEFINNRLIPNAIEPRAAIAQLLARRRQLHALRDEPEPARRAAADDGVRAGPARAQGARDRARRRRRLRLQDLSLRRGNRADVGLEAGQPARSSGPPSAANRSCPTRTAATT